MKTKFLIIVFSISALFAGSKKFTREYTYIASESDSKISSREKSLLEVRKTLLREMGTYIESYAISNEAYRADDSKIQSTFREEVKTLTAGITQIEIKKEKWDGESYYVKAIVEVDPEDVIRRVNNAAKAAKNLNEIDRLKSVLESKALEVVQQKRKNDSLSNIYKAEFDRNKAKHDSVYSLFKSKNVNLELKLDSMKLMVSENQEINRQLKIQYDSLKVVFDSISEHKKKIVTVIDSFYAHNEGVTKSVKDLAKVGMTFGEFLEIYCKVNTLDTYRFEPRRALHFPSIENRAGLSLIKIGNIWIVLYGNNQSTAYDRIIRSCNQMEIIGKINENNRIILQKHLENAYTNGNGYIQDNKAINEAVSFVKKIRLY